MSWSWLPFLRPRHVERRVAGYRVLSRIAASHPGRVYRAEHAMREVPAMLTVLRAGHIDERYRSELEYDLRRAVRIVHPNVARVHEYGRTIDGGFYVATEWASGATVADTVARHGAQPVSRVKAMCQAVAVALIHAHAADVVHGALSPGSISMDDRNTIKVLGFGLSNAGLRRSSDRRHDVHALGRVAYYMLTGRLPSVQPTPPSWIVPNVPATIELLILDCLDPRRCPGDARELLRRVSDVVPAQPFRRAS